jgi:hypothetical protein
VFPPFPQSAVVPPVAAIVKDHAGLAVVFVTLILCELAPIEPVLEVQSKGKPILERLKAGLTTADPPLSTTPILKLPETGIFQATYL